MRIVACIEVEKKALVVFAIGKNISLIYPAVIDVVILSLSK